MTVLELISSSDGTLSQYVGFTCPGCGHRHCLGVGSKATGPKWQWNGSVQTPTLTPSILVRWSSRSPQSRALNNAFFQTHARYATADELPYDVRHVCHSFVTDGRIAFLSDCTHTLKSQTVDLSPCAHED